MLTTIALSIQLGLSGVIGKRGGLILAENDVLDRCLIFYPLL